VTLPTPQAWLAPVEVGLDDVDGVSSEAYRTSRRKQPPLAACPSSCPFRSPAWGNRRNNGHPCGGINVTTPLYHPSQCLDRP
jgi:hypothetical protein